MTLRRRDIMYYMMIPVLFVAALVQSAMLVRAEIGNVKPDLVLILVIVGTLVFGGQRGVLWAFMGGVALDLFSGGPLGASSLALIAAALVASPGYQTVSRFNVVVPLAAAALGTLAYGLTYMVVLYGLNFVIDLPFLSGYGLESAQLNLPFVATLQHVVLPSMAYNTLIMLVLTPFLNMIPESHVINT